MHDSHVAWTKLDPIWPIQDGFFMRPPSLVNIRSESGRKIRKAVSTVCNGLQVFLRGSHLETPEPFARSDVDLFVLYDDNRQFNMLQAVLPGGFDYDIKIESKCKPIQDIVTLALLDGRSVQICGPPRQAGLIPADKNFAWQHWIKYCPSLIPNQLDTENPFSLIHFKLLTRCIGVLSYLRDQMFTRDIDTCIEWARDADLDIYGNLMEIRHALEHRKPCVFDLVSIKRYLHAHFDLWFNRW